MWLTPEFVLSENVIEATFTFQGYASDPDDVDIYLFFDTAQTDHNDAYCYIVESGIGSSTSGAAIGNAEAPITFKMSGVKSPEQGSTPFNTEVYSISEPNCLLGFWMD